MTFAWGLQDSGLSTFMNCVWGFEFDSNIIPFGVYQFTQGFFIFVFSLAQIPVMASEGVSIAQQIINLRMYLIFVGIFGVSALALMLGFKFRKDLKHSNNHNKPRIIIKQE